MKRNKEWEATCTHPQLLEHFQRLDVPVTWKEGDTVKVNGKQGTVRYVYTNGYTAIQFPGILISGGIFNNNSTFGNESITQSNINKEG